MKLILSLAVLAIATTSFANTIPTTNATQCLCRTTEQPFTVSCQRTAQHAVFAGEFDSNFNFVNRIQVTNNTPAPISTYTTNKGIVRSNVVIVSYENNEHPSETTDSSMDEMGHPSALVVIQSVDDTEPQPYPVQLPANWMNTDTCQYVGPTSPPELS